MRIPETAKWIGLALLGLAISAAVAIAASNLVSEQIGIASESVSAGDALAPAVESAARRAGGGETETGTGTGTGNTPAAAGEPEAPAATAEPAGGEGESAAEYDDRLDAREDAREDREKALEDARDERADAREDRLDD